jgi:hypothetical protein
LPKAPFFSENALNERFSTKKNQFKKYNVQLPKKKHLNGANASGNSAGMVHTLRSKLATNLTSNLLRFHLMDQPYCSLNGLASNIQGGHEGHIQLFFGGGLWCFYKQNH